MTQSRNYGLVSISEIGRMLGYGPSTVANWRTRYPDFPAPSDRSARGDQFDLAEVLKWLKANGKTQVQHRVALTLWHAVALTGRPDDAFSVCVLYMAARLDMRTRGPHSDPAADVDPRVDVAVAFDQAREDYPNIELITDPSVSALMPVFDELERLAMDRGASWLIDELLNEYSRLSRDKLDLPGPALWVLIALLTDSVFPVPATRRTILDPAAGAGSLLFPVLTSGSTGSSVDIYGADPSFYQCDLTDLRLRLHGYQTRIERGDVLTGDPFTGLQADIVVANGPRLPQFSEKPLIPSLAAVFGRGDRQHRDLALPLYVSDHLSPFGRGFVVVPLIALTRHSDTEARAHMLRRGIIEGVISLPPGVFENTAVPLAVLIVRPPDGPDRHRDIIMIDGSDPTFTWEPNSVHTAKQVADIYVRTALVVGSGKKVPDQATLVPVLEALAPGAPLSPAVWTTRTPETGPQESADILAQTLEDLRRTRQIACSSQLLTPQPPLTIGDAPAWVTVDQLVNNGILRIHRAPTIKHSEFVENGIPVLTVTSVTQLNGRTGGHLNPDDPRISRTRLTKPGDVIFATIGAKAVVDQEGGSILAGHVVAIEILDPHVITPEVLATYLSTDAVANLATGVTIQRVNPRQASVPLLPPHQARNITTTLTGLRRLHADIVAWLETIDATQQALTDAAAAGVQIGDHNTDAATPAEEGGAE